MLRVAFESGSHGLSIHLVGLQTFGNVISPKVLFEYELETPNSTSMGDRYAPTEFFVGN